jgi:hypothetical protein
MDHLAVSIPCNEKLALTPALSPREAEKLLPPADSSLLSEPFPGAGKSGSLSWGRVRVRAIDLFNK